MSRLFLLFEPGLRGSYCIRAGLTVSSLGDGFVSSKGWQITSDGGSPRWWRYCYRHRLWTIATPVPMRLQERIAPALQAGMANGNKFLPVTCMWPIKFDNVHYYWRNCQCRGSDVIGFWGWSGLLKSWELLSAKAMAVWFSQNVQY